MKKAVYHDNSGPLVLRVVINPGASRAIFDHSASPAGLSRAPEVSLPPAQRIQTKPHYINSMRGRPRSQDFDDERRLHNAEILGRIFVYRRKGRNLDSQIFLTQTTVCDSGPEVEGRDQL